MEASLLKRNKLEIPLDYRETADLVGTFFALKPGPVTGVLVKALSFVMHPLEQGSCHGRPLLGEPHRASWVIAGPLTVFALHGAPFRRRLVLAARLRHRADINIIDVSRQDGHRAGKSLRLLARGRRRRAGAEELLASLGFAKSKGLNGEGRGGGALEILCAIQRRSELSLTVVPIVHSSHQFTPDAPPVSMAARIQRIRPWHVFRRITSLVRTARTGSLKNGTPLVLKDWLEGAASRDGGLAQDASSARVELANRMVSERRACAGPPLEPAWQVKRRVLADPILASYMQEYSLKEGISPVEVLREAQEYIDEIASDYRVGVVRWFCRFVDFLFDRLLDGLDIDRRGIRFLSECDSRKRIVLVCSHKSYVDPLLIGYAMFRSGMVPPHQAAGLNLAFWPVGWLLRHSGAFYLRRTFAGETLYREVFSAYVRYLLAGNYTSVVYIEGTRSRDGKLAKPKLGYLGILAESLRMGVCPDVTLVPAYLGYDKVMEEGTHVREMAGSRKVSESVKGFTNIYRSVNTKLGRAYVKFGKPVSMRSLLEEKGLEGTAATMCEAINGITPVTARSLVAAALLAPGATWVARSEVKESAEALMRYSRLRSLPLVDDPEAIADAIEWFERENRIVPDERGGEEGFLVRGRSRRFLEYNKNIPIAHFLGGALVAASRQARVTPDGGEQDERVRQDVSFARSLLDEEFVLGAGDEWLVEVEDAISNIHGGSSPTARVLASLVSSTLEGYLAAATALEALTERAALSRDDFVEICFEKGERLLEDGTIRREESLSKVTFKNTVRMFARMDILREGFERDESGKDVMILSRGCRFDDREALRARVHSFLSDRARNG